MRFLFTSILQFIVIGFLIKLAIKLLIPRSIRKLFSKSSVALYKCSCEVLHELKENFEGDDVEDDVNEKVIDIDSRKRRKV